MDEQKEMLETAKKLLAMLSEKRQKQEPVWGEQLVELWQGLDFIRETLEE